MYDNYSSGGYDKHSNEYDSCSSGGYANYYDRYDNYSNDGFGKHSDEYDNYSSGGHGNHTETPLHARVPHRHRHCLHQHACQAQRVYVRGDPVSKGLLLTLVMITRMSFTAGATPGLSGLSSTNIDYDIVITSFSLPLSSVCWGFRLVVV